MDGWTGRQWVDRQVDRQMNDQDNQAQIDVQMDGQICGQMNDQDNQATKSQPRPPLITTFNRQLKNECWQ